MKSGLKLLHVIDSLGVGGAEKLLVGVINGLSGYEHHLIILNDPDSLRTAITADCAFLNLGIKSKAGLFLNAARVKRYIKKNKIDLVHAHLYRANILSRLATPHTIPLFNTIHSISSLAAYRGSRLSLYLERLTYRRRHHLIAVSKAVLADFEKYVHVKGPVTVLYNFIDEKFFASGPKTEFSKDKLRLVSVGNLSYPKNYPYLLEAFKKIPAQVSLDIYGDGPMYNELQQQIDEYKLNVRLCGSQKDIHTILPRYDAFLMSSFFEGQPLSLLEAMACGLPSFLADIPVLREVTGNDAVYFNTNDPQNLAREVQSALDGKIDLAGSAVALHKRVNEFAHRKQYLEKLNTLYNNL